MDAGMRKLIEDTAEDRVQFVQELLRADPTLGHKAVQEATKNKFGIGFDFYKLKEMKKKPPRDPNKAQHNKAYERKIKFARQVLAKQPMSYEDLNQLAQKKLRTTIPKGIYRRFYKKNPFQAQVVDRVKSDLKKGTSPLKGETKRMGQLFVECGVEEAVMKVIDGVPRWHIVEKRAYDL